MAGSLFVVCVPTRQHEIGLDTAQDAENYKAGFQSKTHGLLKSTTSDGDLLRAEQADSQSRKMQIGPWYVESPSIGPHANCSGSKSNSPRPGEMSRSDPEALHRSGRIKQVYMEEQLERVLKELKARNAGWSVCRGGRYHQVIFSVQTGELCERALRTLAEHGIGIRLDSTVSVIPCALYYRGRAGSQASQGEPSRSGSEQDDVDGQEGPLANDGQSSGTAWERFVQSVRARLTVAQVVEGVRRNASLTFDFLILLIVAALAAALGLLENSTVILVASMLISPLMGPVMAATFGTTINDHALRRMGLVNESVGLLLSLCIGFLYGLVAGCVDRPWPTQEMLERGQLRSLWVNVLIAVLSGAGISIALLRDHTGSLVGVAISASLLPPAVNAGLLWAMSLLSVIGGHTEKEMESFRSTYSDEPAVEMAIMGAISLCLTFINIVFIYIVGIVLLKVKEVAPNAQAHSQFWRHDVKAARDYNTTLYGTSAADLLRSVVKPDGTVDAELVCDALGGMGARGNKSSTNCVPLISAQLSGLGKLDPLAQLTPLESWRHELTWSPSTRNPARDLHLRELQTLYRSLRHQELQRGLRQRRSSLSNLPPEIHVLPEVQVTNPEDLLTPTCHPWASPLWATPASDFTPLVLPRASLEKDPFIADFYSPCSVSSPLSGCAEPSPKLHAPVQPVKKKRFLVTRRDDEVLLLPPP